MDACPGARADEKILDPYQYPGQHVGTIISFWMMSGCMLMLSLWCLNRARSTSGKSSELGERRCMVLLTCHMISCFLAFLLQAIGHSFIPAGQNASLLLVGRIFLALAAGSIQAVGTGIGEARWPNGCIWAFLWLMTLCSTIGFVTAVLLGSDHGDLVQASIMSFAYVWIGFIWAAMYGGKRWNGEEVAWFKTKIACGLVLALLFWIFPLLEPTCGTTGHWNCYKSCPVGGPGLPYFIFTALYLGTMMGVAMAQDKVPDQASCWFFDRFRKAQE